MRSIVPVAMIVVVVLLLFDSIKFGGRYRDAAWQRASSEGEKIKAAIDKQLNADLRLP
jgi:hypothetical protein